MKELRKSEITWDDFSRVEIKVGVVIEVNDFPRAHIPSYKVKVDFGDVVGIKQSSIRAKSEYSVGEIVGRQVIAVTNLPPKNIGGFLSEVLILGVPAEDGSLVLLQPSKNAKIGGDVY